MRVSVVILNWNGEKVLPTFLPSVVRYTTLPNSEVVVVDNGSTDDSLTLLKDFPTVRVLPLDKNYGFAEGYNKAIQSIEAQYVVLLNSDVEVTSNWLEPLVGYLDNHEDVVAVQPKIRSYQQRDYFEHAGACGGFVDILGYPYCRGRVLSKVERDMGQYDTPCEVFWTTGACMVIRREAYLKEGGLDTRFFAHMEEIDLCWRLNARGYKLMCLPQSVVYHLGGGALDYDNPRKLYLNFRNDLLMLYKNLTPTWKLYLVMALRWTLDYLALLQNLIFGKFAHARAIFRARRDYHRMKPTYRSIRRDNLQKTTTPISLCGCVIVRVHFQRTL